MGSADCEPTSESCRSPSFGTANYGPSSPGLGPFLLGKEKPAGFLGLLALLDWGKSRLRRPLRLHRQVAERAIKVAAGPGLDKLKAGGRAVSPHHPRLPVHCRKLGLAELATLRAPEIFYPSAANGHPINMSLQCHDSSGNSGLIPH